MANKSCSIAYTNYVPYTIDMSLERRNIVLKNMYLFIKYSPTIDFFDKCKCIRIKRSIHDAYKAIKP